VHFWRHGNGMVATRTPETTKPNLAGWAKCLIQMVPEKGIAKSMQAVDLHGNFLRIAIKAPTKRPTSRNAHLFAGVLVRRIGTSAFPG
jgi:hypothetical protein